MKDDYKRRRKAERHLIRTLADGGPNVMFTPIRQELLDTDCGDVSNVCSEGSEFIVTSTDEFWLQVYTIEQKKSKLPLNPDLISEISDTELVPQFQTSKSLWYALPRRKNYLQYGDLTFITLDVVVCIIPGAPASVCAFCVRTGERLAMANISGAHFQLYVTEISDTEFVVASYNGNLYFFSHAKGQNLRETSRIWKAHTASILSVIHYKGILLSASIDWTTRLWDLQTRKRLAVLHHDREVEDVAISDDYIVTCSRYTRTHLQKGEIRIYENQDGYTMLKILRHIHFMASVNIVDNRRILCRRFGMKIRKGEFERDFLLIIDIERECVVAQLKVSSRCIHEYTVLVDGRVVVGGVGGCRGVIATFPPRVRQLICESDKKRAFERRAKCTLM